MYTYNIYIYIYIYILCVYTLGTLFTVLLSPLPKPCWRTQQGAKDKLRQRILCNEMDLLISAATVTQTAHLYSPTSSWIIQGLKGCRNQQKSPKIVRHALQDRKTILDITNQCPTVCDASVSSFISF